MRKLLSFVFAALLVASMAGLAGAHSTMYDAKTGMSYMTVPVYNNSGSTLNAGDTVVWDVDASTGDNDAYVTTTTTANTNIVAGVIYPSDITAANVGSMAVWGLVECDVDASGVSAAGPLCTSTTAGEAGNCSANPEHSFAVAATAGGGTKVNCVIK